MGGRPVHSDVEASALLCVYNTVQKGRTLGTDIFMGELDVEVHCVEEKFKKSIISIVLSKCTLPVI